MYDEKVMKNKTQLRNFLFITANDNWKIPELNEILQRENREL